MKGKALRRKIEELESVVGRTNEQHVWVTDTHIQIGGKNLLTDFNLNQLPSGVRIYFPPPSGVVLHEASAVFKAMMGPFGSGKSTCCIFEMLQHAIAMPECTDGIRRSAWVVIRNTTPQLLTSTLKTWKHWFSGLGTTIYRHSPVVTASHTFNDGKGLVNMEVMFLACDKEGDVEKFRSTEYTGAYLNELSALPEALIVTIVGRVGRYPPTAILTARSKKLIVADTNPPDTDHWFYKLFEEQKPDGYVLVKQPPGLRKNSEGKWETNPEAENLANLTDNYYTDMALKGDEEFIKVMCLGEYGMVSNGRPVFPEYNDDIHSVDELSVSRETGLRIGCDFGFLTPAIVVGQYVDNQLRIIKEFAGQNIGVEELLTTAFIPWLNDNNLSVSDIEFSDGDPSDPHSSSTGISNKQILRKYGIMTRDAATNKPALRIATVKTALSALVSGKPQILISRKGCPILRKGLAGEYQYRRVQVLNEERYHDKPDKSHPISDVQDALQYLVLRLFGDAQRRPEDPNQPKPPAYQIMTI